LLIYELYKCPIVFNCDVFIHDNFDLFMHDNYDYLLFIHDNYDRHDLYDNYDFYNTSCKVLHLFSKDFSVIV